MTALLEDKDTYLSAFAEFEKGLADQGRWTAFRHAAMDRFVAQGFPTTDDEEWRFTPLTSLTQVPFKLAERPKTWPNRDRILRAAPDAGPCHLLVFVDGHFAPSLSDLAGLPAGVTFGNLTPLLASRSKDLERNLGQLADIESNPFVALNSAFLHDGPYLHVPASMVIEKPIHLVFASSADGDPLVSHPRTLIVAEENSQVSLVESYVSLGAGVALSNAVTEVVVKPSAIVHHCKLLRENDEAFHVATLQVRLAKSSTFTTHNFTVGGKLVRNDINAYLGGENAECTLNGLYLGSGRRLVDNHTRIDHAMPHCQSHELYKGILDGHSRGVFNGKIYVHPDAQKTDAKQTNQALLLSPDAVIDTKPQLEIYADDVKCTHGATIGQLEPNALFYLRSRGIDLAAARSLLTFAFANDVIRRVEVEPIRAQLEHLLLTTQNLPAYLIAPEVE